jgi:glycosyltransferase involved in cell wall biosynthesis
MDRLKVFVSAYACEPGKGSEPEVGWRWIQQITRFHETWVITRANNRPLIEQGLKTRPNPNLHFVYIDLPAWARLWKRGRRGVHLYYYLWQIIAYRRAFALSKHIHFDLAHHITFINMYMGPWFALLPLPFVWGPIGANPDIPKQFYPLIGSSGIKDNRLRYAIRKISPFVDPVISLAKKKAKRILTINEEVRSRLEQTYATKSLSISQNAIDRKILAEKSKPFHYPLKILSVGQLVSIKGYRLSLAAFAKHLSVHPRSILEIIGAGPQKDELVKFASELGVFKSVIFSGQVSREKVFKAMTESDMLLFPSFEGAGMVVIEAMGKGLPIVCLDHGGPGEYVTEECGIKVPLTDPETVIQGLADALSRLASDPALYERLSTGAIKRVREHYLWDRVGDRLNALYREVMEEDTGRVHG